MVGSLNINFQYHVPLPPVASLFFDGRYMWWWVFYWFQPASAALSIFFLK